MIIKKFSTKRLQSEEITIDSAGIYTLTGENGSGKTTFLEQIIRENVVDEKECISYSPQRYLRYQTSVRNYFIKEEWFHRGQVYLKDFGLHLSGSESILNLSGGEFVKVNLSRNFAMNKSIIILDEPTNSLDDESVEVLKRVLEEFAKEKIVLVASHDERLFFEKSRGNFEIREKNVFLHAQKTGAPVLKATSSQAKYPVIRRLFHSNFNQQFFLLLALVSMIALFFTAQEMYYNFPLYDKFTEDGYLEMLNIEGENSLYFQATHSKKVVENTKGTQLFDFDKLEKLAKKPYVQTIYYVDESYLNTLTGENQKIELFSLPNVVANSPHYKLTYPGAKGFVLQGRLPKDGTNEAMVSYPQMQQFFQFEGQPSEMMGKKIRVNGKEYEVVGISETPHIILAYHENENYGFIKFKGDRKQYEKRVNELEKLNYNYTEPSNIFVEYQAKYSKELMNFINENVRSYQLVSNYVGEYLLKKSYLENIPWLLLLSLGASVIGGLLLIYFGQKSVKSAKALINDAVNITLDPRKVYLKTSLVILLDFVLITPVVFLFIGQAFGFGLLKLIFPFLTLIILVMSLMSYFSIKKVKFD